MVSMVKIYLIFEKTFYNRIVSTRTKVRKSSLIRTLKKKHTAVWDQYYTNFFVIYKTT